MAYTTTYSDITNLLESIQLMYYQVVMLFQNKHAIASDQARLEVLPQDENLIFDADLLPSIVDLLSFIHKYNGGSRHIL